MIRGSLDDALTVCLGLLAREPARFEPAAVVWHRRWCDQVSEVGFAESHAVLSALEGLRGSDPAAAARALRTACLRHGLDQAAAVLEAWLDADSVSGAGDAGNREPEGTSAA